MEERTEKPEWHIMTISRGGTVSHLKDLTETVARQMMQQLPMFGSDGDPWSDEAIVLRVLGVLTPRQRVGSLTLHPILRSRTYSERSGDLLDAKCFGADGRALDVWPKPADYEARYAAALEAARKAA